MICAVSKGARSASRCSRLRSSRGPWPTSPSLGSLQVCDPADHSKRTPASARRCPYPSAMPRRWCTSHPSACHCSLWPGAPASARPWCAAHSSACHCSLWPGAPASARGWCAAHSSACHCFVWLLWPGPHTRRRCLRPAARPCSSVSIMFMTN